MKFLNLLLSPLLVIWSGCSSSPSGRATPFSALCGQWQGKAGNGVFYENWRQEDDLTYAGEGYYVEKGDTLVSEKITICKISQFWCFIAIVNESSPVLFTLSEPEGKEWIFENREHDFPQRVIYSMQEDGSLVARVEGKEKGEFRKEEFMLRKVAE